MYLSPSLRSGSGTRSVITDPLIKEYKMSEYSVVWAIELDAESPLEAAEKAHEIMLDTSSTSTVFQVWESSQKLSEPLTIDLTSGES